MEKIPEAIWEIILEPTLIECPRKLLEMRTVSKFFREIIDQYISRPQPWLKACNHIPYHVLDAIVRTKFPLNAWPWQENYWKRSKSVEIPQIIYFIWKNSPPKSNSTRIKNLLLSTDRIVINDRYLAAIIGKDIFYDDKWERYVYIYSLSNIQQHLRQYRINCSQIDFYSAINREFLILYEEVYLNKLKANVYLAEFLVDEELRESNLLGDWFQQGSSSRYMIVENECFTIFRTSVKHRIFDQTGFYTGTEFSLPQSNYNIYNIKIVGSELQVVANSPKISEIFWIYRYQISRKANGTLSFTPNNTNFCNQIPTEFEIDQNFMTAVGNDKYIFRPLYFEYFIGYLDADRFTSDVKHWKKIDFYNRRIIFDRISFLRNFYHVFGYSYKTAVVHGNNFFVGTSNAHRTRIMIFEWNPQEFIDAIMVKRRPQSLSKIIDLVPPRINVKVEWIHISYIGLKLTILVHTSDGILTVVSVPQDEHYLFQKRLHNKKKLLVMKKQCILS